ncbi:flavin reductase family protein [Neorhizobium sp. BT27B]|uniref:flavin reductase family protein n=1 Tax=Neorhizobium sp. BT27B TaxID=3142625 RepID=UPI003D293B78
MSTLAASLAVEPTLHLAAPSSEDLKAVMRHVAGTVSVVTAGDREDRTGATVTSATALSVDPPTMIVNINRSSSTWPVIARHGHFCVNILDIEDQVVAERFSGKDGLKGGQRYGGAEWTTLVTGAAALVGSLASIDCEVEEVIERHSHAIIIGRVVAVRSRGGSPLVYSHGKYGSVLS